jgi:hypothetical protein
MQAFYRWSSVSREIPDRTQEKMPVKPAGIFLNFALNVWQRRMLYNLFLDLAPGLICLFRLLGVPAFGFRSVRVHDPAVNAVRVVLDLRTGAE